MAMCLLQVGFAAPRLELRATSVCAGGIYGELSPRLGEYSVALAFCSAAYPVECTSADPVKREEIPINAGPAATLPIHNMLPSLQLG